jgi:hypothetical protein
MFRKLMFTDIKSSPLSIVWKSIQNVLTLFRIKYLQDTINTSRMSLLLRGSDGYKKPCLKSI